jgi:hypothetical protein
MVRSCLETGAATQLSSHLMLFYMPFSSLSVYFFTFFNYIPVLFILLFTRMHTFLSLMMMISSQFSLQNYLFNENYICREAALAMVEEETRRYRPTKNYLEHLPGTPYKIILFAIYEVWYQV